MHAPANLLHAFFLSVTTLVSEMNPLHICGVSRKTFHATLLRSATTWNLGSSEYQTNEITYRNRSDMNEELLIPLRKLSGNQPRGGNYPSLGRQEQVVYPLNSTASSESHIHASIQRQDERNGASDQKPDKE
ncbi:hypothetical protein IW261DRAFT_1434162 [Armillaria novae-zelandiae]|uniref:Secreted protein n=1 Tax=Armillaria novae-zelandiae TaxID=153914 RepID=A0AA39PUH9_9AGAR|nr:hypothetical protein IW261DRAFT_1434162 [Armillaria novae-zelandiae]